MAQSPGSWFTLVCCSLVSKAWLPHSTSCLFDDRYVSVFGRGRLDKLASTIDTSPPSLRLASCVRYIEIQLDVIDSSSTAYGILRTLKLIDIVVSCLPLLEEVCIDGYYGIDDNLSRFVPPSFLSGIPAKSIQRLKKLVLSKATLSYLLAHVVLSLFSEDVLQLQTVVKGRSGISRWTSAASSSSRNPELILMSSAMVPDFTSSLPLIASKIYRLPDVRNAQRVTVNVESGGLDCVHRGDLDSIIKRVGWKKMQHFEFTHSAEGWARPEALEGKHRHF